MEGKMTEKKKKRRIIKQIFKWLGLGLLVALIMGALIYDAPWKVLALLIIILAAHTILPKAAIKWFWLSVAAVVVILIIWVSLPDETEGWRPYTFDEELAALQAKYAVPDNENAALLYDKLFETLDIDSNQPKFFAKTTPSSRDGPWLSKDHPETAEWLKGRQKTIGTLMEISRIEKCRFSITSNPMNPEPIERLSKMRPCAFLLLSSANNDIAEGRTDAGLEKYLCIIQLAKHLHQQPTLVDFLVGGAIEALALKQLNRFMIEGDPSREQLQLIANSIKELEDNWSSDFSRRLDYEKLFYKNSLCSLFYEANPQSKVRLRRDPAAMMRFQYPDKPVPQLSYRQRKLGKAGTILGWFFFPSTPQKFAKIIDATYGKYYAMTDPNFEWGKKPAEVQPQFKLNYLSIVNHLTDISGEAYSRIHEIYLRNLTYRRGSRLLTAIAQYKIENNAWPGGLDAVKSLVPAEALIDPVGGKQLEYENHGKRFSLYGETTNIWPK
jgi:hypothetical protein